MKEKKQNLWAEYQNLHKVVYVLIPFCDYKEWEQKEDGGYGWKIDEGKRKKSFAKLKKKVRRLIKLIKIIEQNESLDHSQMYTLYKESINEISVNQNNI